MFAIILAIISGLSMTIQGVFNTQLEKKLGTWETNLFAQGTAFILTLIIVLIFGKGNIREIKNVNKLYLLTGVLGVIIIFTVIKSIGSMGPTVGIGIILVSQLLSACLIDYFGLFGCEKVTFSLNEFLGAAFMIAGIVIFKFNF